MLKKMVEYLMRNREVVTLVVDGKASLLGVSAKEQRALIEVIGDQGQDQGAIRTTRNYSATMHWYA